MDLRLEVVLSSCIKRKKPWPRFCWLGLEKESVFLLDDRRISEINMVSGRTKKKTPKLQLLLPRVVTMAASHNGMWLAGLLVSGDMFLWNRDRDSLKTVTAVSAVSQLVTDAQGSGTRLLLSVSGDGMRVLLLTLTGQVFLWECVDVRDLVGVRDGPARGRWAHIEAPEDTPLPSPQDKEGSQHSAFIRTEALGDVSLSVFTFTTGEKLIVTFLKIQWEDGRGGGVGSVGYRIRWVTRTCPMSRLSPPCRPVKSRGALVSAFSPDGLLLAIVLNQRDPRATQVLFVSTQTFVTVSSGLGGCGSKKLAIPSKYVRSYWVGSVSWAVGGLYLACVLKRGSLLMLARLGGLLSLSTSGCNVDFGPAHFLPLHPLVTYKPPAPVGARDASLSSSSASVRDALRQRYSVTWHPRLPYLIVSDGYLATVLRTAERPSPAALLRALLRDTSQGLERASRALENAQPHARAWLEAMSCLKLSSSLEELRPRSTSAPSASGPRPPASSTSTLPLFLQDQAGLGNTREMLQKVQALFEDDSDLEGPPTGSHVEDGGRLEFASMFDTLHAHPDTPTGPRLQPRLPPQSDPDSDSVDSDRKAPPVLPELRRVQGSLLTAWALGVSLGGAVEQREHLLRGAVRCAVRFAALLRLTTEPTSCTGRKKSPSFSSCLLRLLRTLLSFLPWDGAHTGGRGCLGLVVELTHQLVSLVLSPPPDPWAGSEPPSHRLSSALLILQLAARSLDHAYSLQQDTAWGPPHQQGEPAQLLWASDGYCVPLLQEEVGRPRQTQEALPRPQRPSSRLAAVWRTVYQLTLQYWEELRGPGVSGGRGEEQGRVIDILSHLQAALQGAGQKLEDGPPLLSYTGEHHFLFGAYTESADAWRAELWAERERGGPRGVFLETRLVLAQLYGLLFRYRLREAQALGDHMARLLLDCTAPRTRARTQARAEPLPVSGPLPGSGPLPSGIPREVHNEAACAVVQTLGRFMASYFTNQPLLILPPHSVDVLPPLHLPHVPGVGRLVPLCQERVAGAVRGQQLSEVWTVGYAQDLLLQGGLLPEAVWLALRLGDWKSAVSLGLAYTTYCTDHCHLTGLRWRELHLPAALEPGSIFQTHLESLLGRKSGREETQGDEDDHKSFTDSLEGEDMELLQASLQELLKASVMAGVDVLSQPLRSLLDSAKDLASRLPALVPTGLYLPAPPLYCPQPAPNTQDPSGALGQLAEGSSRHRVSGVLQRALLLLRSARCSHPAAQWYISQLRRSRRLLHKIRQKSSQQSGAPESFPEGLVALVSRSSFFRRGPGGDGRLDAVTIQTIMCFRELCGLCWMLHVRDQLSAACRRFQAARNPGRDAQAQQQNPGRDAQAQQQNPGRDAQAQQQASCVEAVQWACRLLPFARFLNAEEVLQDALLSLVSELPPSPLVAVALVGAFPEEEESVRVPLRDKYSSLLQRLRHCSVPASESSGKEEEEDEGGEMMMVLIRDKLRLRRKHLRRLGRHLGPPELHLWEREEEEEREGGPGAAMLERFSLGASLSNSTLTDCGRPLVYSDGDTAENTSEALSLDQSRPTHRKRVNVQGEAEAGNGGKMAESVQEEVRGRGQDPAGQTDPGPPALTLPVVGTWEFELEDEEYLRFLELFLSYVLERASPDGGAAGRHPPPLLKGFCSALRERELHSLSFDVLTTLRRRQQDGRHASRRPGGGGDAPVFRAGHCFKTAPDTPDLPPSSLRSEVPPRPSLSVLPLPGLRTGQQQPGLFGLRRQVSPAPEPTPTREGLPGSEPSPSQSSVPWEQLSEPWALGSPALADLQQELDPELEARFPGLARLLEWMVRWADKRALHGPPSRKRDGEVGGGGGVSGAGVVIRVKASAPAVLTALGMLRRRYAAALLETSRYCRHIQVPEGEWTVAPVLQPEGVWRREREGSYPASAAPPVTLPDQEPQHGRLASSGSKAEGVERVTSQQTSDHRDQEGMTFDLERGVADSQRPSPDEELDLIAEQEDNSDAVRASPAFSAPGISVQIKSLPPSLTSTQDQVLTLEDLQGPQRDGHSSSSQGEDEDESLLRCDSLRRATPDPVEEVAADRAPGEAPGPEAPPQPAPRLLPTAGPQAGAPSADLVPGGTLPQSHSAAAPPGRPPPAQADPVRQLLQDEMFRLVQLQQINFMSLMQVVGASFSNLPFPLPSAPLVQSQNPPLVQSQDPPLAQNQNPPLVQNQNASLVRTSVTPAPQTQPGAPETASHQPPPTPASTQRPPVQPAPQTSAPPPPAPRAPLTSHAQTPTDPPVRGEHDVLNPQLPQGMQTLSVHLEPSGGVRGESSSLVPSSLGLLTTVDARPEATPTGLSLLPPHRGRQQEAPNPPPALPPSGLKLLQLRPPLLSLRHPPHSAPILEAWGPLPGGRATAGPPHVNLTLYDPDALRTAREGTRGAERDSAAPPKHLNLDRYSPPPPDPPPGSTQPLPHDPAPPHLPPAAPAPRPPPAHGLPLLRFYPDTRPPTNFPHIPHLTSSRPLTLPPAPLGHAPGVKLLQRGPDPPRMMVPLAALPARVPRLIPLEVLMGWAAGRQGPGEPRLQLLRADPQTRGPAPVAPPAYSSKRQRRREDRRRREGQRAEVTFRAGDSIIPPQEVPQSSEEPAESALGEGFVFPLGTFDPMLTGQGLVDRAMSTAAELHAFASTRKRPPESLDACTNTDPAPPHSPADGDGSVGPPGAAPTASPGPVGGAAVLPPDVFLNLQFPREPAGQNTDLPQNTPAGRTMADVEDRQFINVIDLEDGTLLQDMPRCPQPSPPTSAQLHLLAASVTNSALPELRPADTNTEDQPPAQPGLSEASEPGGDPVTVSLLLGRSSPGGALEPHGHGARRAVARPPGVQISACLSEMDAQLAALQNIADNMEREFANTRLLVSTIETLAPAMAPHAERRTPMNKTVTLAVSPEAAGRDTLSLHTAWRSRPSGSHDPQPADHQEEEEGGQEVSGAPRGQRQRSSLPAAIQSTSTRHTPADLTDHMAGTSRKGTEDTLGLSGLTDVADILGELVREGAMSPSALGLSHTQAARLDSRQEQQRSRRPAQRGAWQAEEEEEEQRDLRTWMRSKQRERLAEYRRQKEERRANERRPFTAPAALQKPTSKDLNINRKIKEEKDKMLLMDHHNQRAREACSLITDLLTTPLTLPTTSTQTLTSTSTRPLTSQTAASTRSSPRGRSSSAGGRRRSLPSQVGRGRSMSCPRTTPRVQRRPASREQDTLSSRLGLHRPASALPRDRLSQVTRRGMLTDLKGRAGPQTANQERRIEVSQSPAGRKGGGGREQRETEEREVVSPWNPPPEICRLLGMDNPYLGQGVAGPSEAWGGGARAGAAWMDRLDTLSESTGSVLSKLDWAAIESMVAGEGEV